MRILTTALAISAIACTPLAAQDGQHPLAPDTQALIDAQAIHMPEGQWSLSPAVDGCSVQREFLLDEDRVTLVMKRLQKGMPVQFVLVGGGFEPDEGLQAGFMPGRSGLAEFRYIGSASAGERAGIFFAGQPFPGGGFGAPTEDALAHQTRYYVAQNDDDDAVVLRTGRIDLALDALTQCADEQLAALGVDPRRGAVRSSAPVNWGTLIPRFTRAYEIAVRERRGNLEGDLPIRLIINERGELAHCHAGTGLTPRALREAVCTTIRERGEFRTALNADGEAVTDLWTTNLRFRIAKSSSWPGADGRNYPAD